MGASIRLLDQVRLHDAGSVMQSFARSNPTPTGTWFFAQVMQDGRFGEDHACHMALGDLTLSHLPADGSSVLSWMYLRGFGHGEAISVQQGDPSGEYIWIEAVSAQGPDASFPDGFGTRIARFAWQAGATITPFSPGVELYDPHPGTLRNAPSLDLAGGLIAARYADDAGAETFDVYDLAAFVARDFTPLRSIPLPAYAGTGQGWALLPGGTQIARLTGDHYGNGNDSPGDTYLTTFDASGIVAQDFITDDEGLTWREPEGVQPIGGQVCTGFASGDSSDRRASIYARTAGPAWTFTGQGAGLPGGKAR